MKTRRRLSVLAALVVAASAAFLPRAAQATEEAPKYSYTMTTLSEQCGGKCGTKGLCCKIVIVGPSPVAENVNG